ncbi:platelet endothelial aggregation receptor 1-like [Haliotis rubra]|uniref:platelet endothelial aggregation receptor 1-like n=1 Tax=Haliotis rubra TaxID=36100 RepID=UPI001EE62219|nr:platelet endothelial aggregation receptor 1-like [Haliotis rubra]
MSECSRGCENQLCELAETGIEYCTDGCVPGYMGTSCKIPCDKPKTQCTVCEGGCDGGYCWLSSTSCVSGCVDSYYGLDCKDCSERCKSCNRSTGMCNDCRDPYRGLNCEMSCENCAGSCVSGCDEGCKPGFYGHWCDKVCSENCRPGPNKTAVSVLECDQNTSINCIPECDNNTGDCIHGCNDGWYGENCSSRCSRKCTDMSCTVSGSCAAGCAPGYAGTDCSCFENCIHHVCHPNNGTCAKKVASMDIMVHFATSPVTSVLTVYVIGHMEPASEDVIILTRHAHLTVLKTVLWRSALKSEHVQVRL